MKGFPLSLLYDNDHDLHLERVKAVSQNKSTISPQQYHDLNDVHAIELTQAPVRMTNHPTKSWYFSECFH